MRRIARVLIGLAVLAIVVGITPGVVHAGGPFTDDDDSIFESDINWLAAEGITKGCNPPSNTRFCPNASVTRGQMAAFLVRALGYTTNPPGDRFTDDNGSIFEADIEKLAAAGVTKGCNPPSNTRFCPNASVTRGQMAAFLHRALGRNAPGYEYIEVAGDTGTLSMRVPTVWNDVDGSSWEFEGELVGPALSAAPNLERFLETWTTPGVFFGASEVLTESWAPGDLLDYYDFSGECSYDGRSPYEDGYTGSFDVWSRCGGRDTILFVLEAYPPGEEFVILLQVQAVTAADLEALDVILESMYVDA